MMGLFSDPLSKVTQMTPRNKEQGHTHPRVASENSHCEQRFALFSRFPPVALSSRSGLPLPSGLAQSVSVTASATSGHIGRMVAVKAIVDVKDLEHPTP